MKKLAMVLAGIVSGGLAQADDLQGVNEMICAVSQVHICIENDSCYATSASDLNVPEFVVINTKKKTLSTTKGSGENRTTPFTKVERDGVLITLQGMEGGRAFSFVIDEATGRMTVAVSRDGIAVNVFGACTSTDL